MDIMIEDGLLAVRSGSQYLMTVQLFPAFFLAHFVLATIGIREDSKHLGERFPQKHPFTSWLCTLLASLSGAFVASFLFGDPLLEILKEKNLILFLSVIWYVMNYSPFDVVYKLVKRPLFIVPMALLQECLRVQLIYLGVQSASMLYPTSPLIMMVGGAIKGNGYGYLKIIERLVRGHWNPKTNEFLEPTYFAKSGALASSLFVLHHFKTIEIPIEYLYFTIFVAFIIGRLLVTIGGITDPLAPLQAPFCRIVFGSWEEDNTSNKQISEKQLQNNDNQSFDKNVVNNKNNSSRSSINHSKLKTAGNKKRDVHRKND